MTIEAYITSFNILHNLIKLYIYITMQNPEAAIMARRYTNNSRNKLIRLNTHKSNGIGDIVIRIIVYSIKK